MMLPQIFTIRIGINKCYLVKEDGIIIIDSGPPKRIHGFQKAFEKFQIEPTEARLILLTHGDPDHAGSAKALKALTGAEIAIHDHDKLNLEHSIFNFPPGVNSWGRLLHFILYPILKNVIPSIPTVKADIVLDDKNYSLTDFGIAGQIVYTPGHTQGSVSVVLETGEAFVG
jgi:hydroxyacylglutathione hydrolase